MDGYVRLFDAQGRTDGDGPTIGLILCAEKNEAIARYSILSEHKQLFEAKYVTYLPSVEELERELERDRRIAETIVETPLAAKAHQTVVAHQGTEAVKSALSSADKRNAIECAFGETVVGARGFEPPTPWSQTRCATRLRYAPMLLRALHEYLLGGDLARSIRNC
jgi:nuclease YhcG-like protein